MKKIISFCVYGPHSLYNDGAYENIAEAKEYYPDWTCRFYIANDVPILPKLLEAQYNKECEVVIKNPESGIKGMFWRLEAISDPNVEYVVFRDTDQRVNDKEAQCVFDWIKSDKNSYRIHEGFCQDHLILMGCAWGIKGGIIKNIDELMNKWLEDNKGKSIGARKRGDNHDKKDNLDKNQQPKLFYGSDQMFLEEVVWPLISGSCKTYGVLGEDFLPHKQLKWNSPDMYKRIAPFTNCREIIGVRPNYAYETEEK